MKNKNYCDWIYFSWLDKYLLLDNSFLDLPYVRINQIETGAIKLYPI